VRLSHVFIKGNLGGGASIVLDCTFPTLSTKKRTSTDMMKQCACEVHWSWKSWSAVE